MIAEDVNLLRGIFLVRDMSKFLAVGRDSAPSPGFPIKVQGKEEGQSTPGGGNKATSKDGTFLVRRGIPGYNSGR